MTDEAKNKKETSAKPAPVTKKRGRGTVYLLLLIALAALASSLYLLQQQRTAEADIEALNQGMTKLQSVVKQQHEDALEQMKTAPEHTHPQTDAELDQMRLLLEDMRTRLGQDRRGWALAEAEHLVRIAEHGLVLGHDPVTAVAALRTAKNRLAVEDDRGFAAIIARLDNDIRVLNAIRLPDRDAIAKTLSEIGAKIETLPLNPQVNPLAERPSQDTKQLSGWDRFWADMGSLITVRRDEEVLAKPILAPEQRYFLTQNLQLKVETARLALLLDNAPAWLASLKEATEWLRRYFDPQDKEVTKAISTLEKFTTTVLKPDLPDLSADRDMIRRMANSLPPRARGGKSTGAKQ